MDNLNSQIVNEELKIVAPEGYEIDKENSTFECIKFKKKDVKWRNSGKLIMYIDENLRRKLTDDDVKVLKHLQSIDNLFKKGNLNIYEIFCNNGLMEPTILLDGEEYEIGSFNNIRCDGGDPDHCGRFGLHPHYDLFEKLEEEYEE